MNKTWWNSPFGWIEIAEREGRVWSVAFVDASGLTTEDTPLLRQAAHQLDVWFARARTDISLPLAQRGTPFQQKVWRAASEIPFGHSVTYGELADSLGHRNLARAVGAALAANPWLIVVPCHRVVPRGGGVGGYVGGEERKRALLEWESQKFHEIVCLSKK